MNTYNRTVLINLMTYYNAPTRLLNESPLYCATAFMFVECGVYMCMHMFCTCVL